MKKTKMLLSAVSLMLLCAIIVGLAGCSTRIEAEDLMKDVNAQTVQNKVPLSDKSIHVTDFAIRLFRAANADGENTLISPLSVLCALAISANGAKGETLEQIENTLGLEKDELNLYLYSYITSLPQGEKYKLYLANSIWLTEDERFTVNGDFLQANADYYGADIYKAPFDDKQTLKDINNWVKNETDGMIPSIVDQIPPEAVAYLVNALAFEAEWKNIYEKGQVKDGYFTNVDGEKQSIEMMYSSEGRYIEDDNATGFIKYYSGEKYAFVALLPKEGISVTEYIATLDGESVNNMLNSAQYTTVDAAIPKFESEYEAEMSSTLKSMGVTLAFAPDNADFTGLGTSTDGNIFINRVIHKAKIQVGEKGTKAGAATVIEMVDKMSMPAISKHVFLDRPFVYMLVDSESNLPFFIGTMTDINA